MSSPEAPDDTGSRRAGLVAVRVVVMSLCADIGLAAHLMGCGPSRRAETCEGLYSHAAQAAEAARTAEDMLAAQDELAAADVACAEDGGAP